MVYITVGGMNMANKWLMILLLVSAPLCHAEIISSVSFNPSRMGEYTYLKITDKANLKGGLNATTMNINSGGTVTMTTDNSARIYDVPTVTGASGSAINMPNTAFHGNTSNTYSSYKSESTSAPSGLLPSVAAKGGTQTYNNDSYIQTLDAVNMLKQKVGSLKGGTLEITGNGGSTVGLYDSGNTAGFHLAGNDIPEPTAAHTNTGTNLTQCQLAWEKRKTSDSTPKEVWLLALQNCGSGAGGCDDSLKEMCVNPPAKQGDLILLSTPGTWNAQTCECTCPSGSTLQSSGYCQRSLKPIDPVEPTEPTYQWVMTDQGFVGEGAVGSPMINNNCLQNCMSSSLSTIERDPMPSTKEANAFTPACSSSTVGKTCVTQATVTASGEKWDPNLNNSGGFFLKRYCPTYTCKAVY